MSVRSCISKYAIGGFIASAFVFWLLSVCWPLSKQSVIGTYRYYDWNSSASSKEYIQLLANTQYVWVADRNGAVVKAKGRWQISNWGWAGLSSRDIILEKIQFFDSSGLKVEFSGSALATTSIPTFESPPTGQYGFRSYFGKGRCLVAGDYYWVKEK